MKTPKRALLALALLTLSQWMCATEKTGVNQIYVFVDGNGNGTPDPGEESVAGATVDYAPYDPQTTDAQGLVTVQALMTSQAQCQELNRHNNLSVSLPAGYQLVGIQYNRWDCDMWVGSYFSKDQESIQTYVLVQKVAVTETPAVSVAPATSTPLPSPTVQVEASPTWTPVPQPRPSLDIEVTAIPAQFSRKNIEVRFMYFIRNTGNVPLTGPFLLKDVTSDLASITCTQYLETAVIQPGEFIQCGGSHKTTDADIKAGFVGDLITVKVIYSEPLINTTLEVTAQGQAGSVYVAP
ncbi:MAG: hypothetical protein U0Z26_18545 [Anaerolineales bacterium]